MKLDERILPGKRPLTCFDIEEARKFEGKEGYFSDYPRAFADGDVSIDQCAIKGILKLDECHDNCPYINKTTCLNYPYFLPAEWINTMEPEKEWRPYSLTEWRHEYAIGDEIVFRTKNSDTVKAFMFCGLYSDHDDDLPGKGVINLGGKLFVLQNLFDQFELRKNNEWQPFGVIDEDKE